jgi:hypothetical protein
MRVSRLGTIRVTLCALSVVAGAMSAGAMSAGATAHATPDTAEPEASEPTVALEFAIARPDQRMRIWVSGFESQYVTISFCGNEALRGSVDCNMADSEGLRIDPGLTLVQIPVSVPPTTCPCVVRVSDRSQSQVATSPFVIEGHPIGPLRAPEVVTPTASIEVTAVADNNGLAPSAISGLGGATRYRVTVTVRNTSSETISDLAVRGSVGRNDDDVVTSFDVGTLPELGGGAAWSSETAVEVPGPTFGDLVWRAGLVSSGPSADAAIRTNRKPWLLGVAAGLLVVDFGVLAIRWRMRSRRRCDDHQVPLGLPLAA